MTPELLRVEGMGEGLDSFARLGSARLPRELAAVSAVGITDGAKAHLATRIPGKRIYVAPDPLAARAMLSKISSFPDVRAVFLPTATTCWSVGRVMRRAARERGRRRFAGLPAATRI